MDVLASLVALLFPARCVGCGAAPAALCPTCLAGARPAPARPEPPPPPGVDWWVAAFTYDGAVREALARVKYRNARSPVPILAGVLVRRLKEHSAGSVDVVTWPPTTAVRRRQRGFDQAEHLARAVGRGLGVPVRPCLARSAGPSQTGRSAEERRRGPAFRARPVVAGLRVLVIDDVATTGATLAAAARALRSAGAGGVAAATVARTPRRQRPPVPAGERCGSVAGPSSRPTREPLSHMSRSPTSGRESPSGGAETPDGTHPAIHREPP